MNDAKRSDGLVGELGKNGNGRAPARWVEIHMRMDLNSGEFDAQVVPPPAVHNRSIMYAMLEMMRDVVYRQQLPGELAILQHAQDKQIVVAPDGAVPPFPGRM